MNNFHWLAHDLFPYILGMLRPCDLVTLRTTSWEMRHRLDLYIFNCEDHTWFTYCKKCDAPLQHFSWSPRDWAREGNLPLMRWARIVRLDYAAPVEIIQSNEFTYDFLTINNDAVRTNNAQVYEKFRGQPYDGVNAYFSGNSDAIWNLMIDGLRRAKKDLLKSAIKVICKAHRDTNENYQRFSEWILCMRLCGRSAALQYTARYGHESLFLILRDKWPNIAVDGKELIRGGLHKHHNPSTAHYLDCLFVPAARSKNLATLRYVVYTLGHRPTVGSQLVHFCKYATLPMLDIAWEVQSKEPEYGFKSYHVGCAVERNRIDVAEWLMEKGLSMPEAVRPSWKTKPDTLRWLLHHFPRVKLCSFI